MSRDRAVKLLPGAVALALLALAAWMLVDRLSTPSPKPASAPATEFSAARAMRHVRAVSGPTRSILAGPRYADGPAHAAARRYIVGRLKALGLHPRLQRAVAVNRFPGGEGEAGSVTNVDGLVLW